MHSIGARLKAWRDSVKLSQKDAATQLSVPARTYQDYERELRAPGAESIEAFVRAGINANWLLTGEGPMLLGDLVAKELNRVVPTQGPTPAINIDCLAAIIQGTLRVSGHLPAELLAEQIANIYKGFLDKGLLTVDGKQARNDAAAA